MLIVSRAGEEFSVARHENALDALCAAGWQLADEEKEENTDTGADAEVGGANSSKTAGQRGPQFADLAHQFKTLCFGYSLLQRTGVQLNVYNAYFFFPSEKAGRAKLHVTVTCFAIQVGPGKPPCPGSCPLGDRCLLSKGFQVTDSMKGHAASSTRFSCQTGRLSQAPCLQSG